jgi:hypothetical protein
MLTPLKNNHSARAPLAKMPGRSRNGKSRPRTRGATSPLSNISGAKWVSDKTAKAATNISRNNAAGNREVAANRQRGQRRNAEQGKQQHESNAGLANIYLIRCAGRCRVLQRRSLACQSLRESA